MYDYLMNIASASYFICYVPELYANYKNANANIYNMPEKLIVLIGSCFAFAYAMANNNDALITNYGPILGLDFLAFVMRGYYTYKNRKALSYTETSSPSPLEEKESI